MATGARQRRQSKRKDSVTKEVVEHQTETIEPPRPGFFERRRISSEKKKYEEGLEELLENYEKDKELVKGEVELEEEERDTDKFINNFIFYLTIVLIFANSIASYLSGSLSILSTLVDSSMDLSTSTIMGICLHQAQQVDPRYPRGKERLEMIGVILNSVIMGIANVVMIVQSLQAILNDTVDPHMTWHTMLILVTGCSIKFVIMVICYRRGNDSSKCLAMDLRNDILTGTVALICAYLGDAYWKYSDALGAISVCAYIAISWFRNTLEHIPFMVGVAAEKEHLSRILKIAIEHDERIQKIDHIMIYHIGAKALVELHIVMDEKLPLKVTHDISHPLEEKLNRLEFVQRSFVHCDYICDGDH
ncbi:hypothetical protein PFISCL1PPCAC_26944 [Pristionchus fissidentatus]|uniref:Cation efflux protein cytoplasmic domain-containing protein n=1 Tax=Pristionchus fissidentatus TaxID=1538716 RepID=A0AAV5WUH1_9BILA|nr:hypothetical protein PFISCL1PPCAC_26944 [Pristionchus fissidentatus]